MICPDCQAGTRVHKVEGKLRLRECLGCKKRFRTEEVLLHEVGTVTQERLLSFLAERKRWMSYRGLAHYFAVSETTIQTHLKRLEAAGLVICKIENATKLWQIPNKPADPPKPKPAPAPSIVHKIAQPGEEASTFKRQQKPTAKRPTQQSWFSSIT